MHLVQVGAGSGGMAVLDLVARDGRLTRVTLIEPDVYAEHNVARHLFGRAGVGRLKCELAAEWLAERRPDLAVEAWPIDVTAPGEQGRIRDAVAACDVGVCAADNEAAKFHCDALFRHTGKPWTLGEVLSGGVAGWVHRFRPDRGGPCYGCVASHLQRDAIGPAGGDPAAPAVDYADPGAAELRQRVPASRASIAAVASLHALVTLDLLGDDAGRAWTSLLFALAPMPGVFAEAFGQRAFAVPRLPGCLVCGVPASAEEPGRDLDDELGDALGRLA